MHVDKAERTAAVALYHEAARVRAWDPLPYLELAQVYVDWGRYDEALEAVFKAEWRGGDAAELERLRVLIHETWAETVTSDKVSHWKRVMEHGQRVLGLEPADRDVRAAVGRAYLQLREWEAARSLYQELTVSDPTDVRSRERLGILLLGDDPRALQYLFASGTDLAQSLLDVYTGDLVDEDPAYVHVVVGRVLMEHQNWALAAHHLGRAVEQNPGYADAHAYLGRVLDRMGYREQAASHLSAAVALKPKSALAHTFLGLHYDAWGQTADARAEYETAYDLAPDNPAVCVEIGQSWAAEGRYTVAEIWLREAVALRPDDAALWEVLARFYLNHNITSNDRALEATERLSELAPRSAEAHDLRGWAAIQMGSYEAAETHLERAIELDAALASAHYHLGLLRSAQGREHEAETAFERAVDLDTTGAVVPLVERAK